MKKIAIIGAGLSGVTLGKKLSKQADVFIFEKARGIGGRMSTRYADQFVFDHGAQYWTAKTEEFRNFLIPLMGSVVEAWKGNVMILEKDNYSMKNFSEASYLVATPHMNSLCTHLAMDLNIKIQCEVISITNSHQKQWHLTSANNEDLGLYDLVISTAPAPQTLKLFANYLPTNHDIYKTEFESCFALIIGINQPWNEKWIAANIHNSPIKWIGVNSTKPGRNPNITCLIIHSEHQWTNTNLNKNIKEIEFLLLNELAALINIDIQNLSYISTHRWLYSQVKHLNTNSYYIDLDLGIGAVGDWCQISDIETVWLNAQKAADFICTNAL